MSDKSVRHLSPFTRRRLLTALAASPLAFIYGPNGMMKLTDMLLGTQTAMGATPPIRYFIEINLRDQWDFMHFMVPPGLATASNLTLAKNGEKGEERLCGLYQDPKTLLKSDSGLYLTNDSRDVAPHAADIAALETIELCIGSIHGHEAANSIRSPGRTYDQGKGRTAMWLADDGTQQDAGGDEFLYSSTPTPAMVHLNLARQLNGNARAIALKFLGRADKKHTVYHHAASLSDNGFQRIQSKDQLIQSFESNQPKDALTADEMKVMSDLLKRFDSNFIKRMKYTQDATNRQAEYQDSFAQRLINGTKPLSLTLSDAEQDYWSKDVPPEESSAPRMHLWEQAAMASKLITADAVSTVAMEFCFEDIHGPRPKSAVTAQGKIIGMVMARLIADLKSKNLWNSTLIMINTVDGGRSPAVDSYGDSGKNSMILAGGMIKGGYYGDIRVSGNDNGASTYTYHKPDYTTGQTVAAGSKDSTGRVPGVVAYRTILSAMGAPVSMLKQFPDVGDGDKLSCMLKNPV